MVRFASVIFLRYSIQKTKHLKIISFFLWWCKWKFAFQASTTANRWTGWTQLAVNYRCGRICSRDRTSGWRARWRWGQICTITAKTTAPKIGAMRRDDVARPYLQVVVSATGKCSREMTFQLKHRLYISVSGRVPIARNSRTKISAFGNNTCPSDKRNGRDWKFRFAAKTVDEGGVFGTYSKKRTHVIAVDSECFACYITIACTCDSSIYLYLLRACCVVDFYL